MVAYILIVIWTRMVKKKPNKPNGITHHLKFFGKNYMDETSTGYALFEDENTAGKTLYLPVSVGNGSF